MERKRLRVNGVRDEEDGNDDDYAERAAQKLPQYSQRFERYRRWKSFAYEKEAMMVQDG